MKRKIIDVEADGLNPTHIDCIVQIDVDTLEEKVWRYDAKDAIDLSDDVIYIGHHILGFDLPVLNRLTTSKLDSSKCIDTLVCSHLFASHLDGHGLEDWGLRLGEKKGKFNEWTRYDDPDLERNRVDRCVSYCLQDCRTNLKLYKFFEKYIYSEEWKESLRCEHDIAILCQEMKDNGFRFDYDRAGNIKEELSSLIENLSGELSQAFTPRSRLLREINPRLTKHGTLNRSDFRWVEDKDLTKFSAEAPFSLIEFEQFNPGSPKQVVERLNEAGWKPHEKTKGYKNAEKEYSELLRKPRKVRSKDYEANLRNLKERIEHFKIFGWKISEDNLATLPEGDTEQLKACRLFIKWRMLTKRLQTLEEWNECFDVSTRCIHGSFHHIGAWTHRMAHSNPNQGNVPSIDSKYHNQELKDLAYKYGKEMRSCFTAFPDEVLVGCDADGIQLRILAHYMNDVGFIKALIEGNKEDGTDAHTLNAIALGFGPDFRPRAKTFIYAWLLGAGVDKVSNILGISREAARIAIDRFIGYYPGLKKLKEETIPSDASRGWFVGFDGRKVKSDEYHMLAGYLQNGEACIMKHAALKWKKDLDILGIPYRLVDFVHDEWQTSTDASYAELLGSIQAASIKWAGEKFGLNCPLLGQYKIGVNWYETH